MGPANASAKLHKAKEERMDNKRLTILAVVVLG